MFKLTIGYQSFIFSKASQAAAVLESLSEATSVTLDYVGEGRPYQYYISPIEISMSKLLPGQKVYATKEDLHAATHAEV